MGHDPFIDGLPIRNGDYIAMENGHRNSWFTHKTLWFSIVFCKRLPEGTVTSYKNAKHVNYEELEFSQQNLCIAYNVVPNKDKLST